MADTKLISWKVSDFANSDGTWRSELYGFKYYKKEGIRGYVVNSNSRVSLSAGKAFRTKIGMYLSADRQEAINLGLRELIVNVQDEYEVYKPKNPHLNPEPNAPDVSGSYSSAASFNFNFSNATFKFS